MAINSNTPRKEGNGTNIVVGYMGTGKSSFLIKRALHYIKTTGNKVYVLDPHGTLQVPDGYSSSFVFVPLSAHKMKATFDYVMTLTNCMIILDDIRIYTNYGNTTILDLCINHRHRNIEIYCVYHSLANVNKQLWQFSANVFLFMVQDSWQSVKTRTSLELTEPLFNEIRNLPKYHFLYFKLGKLEKWS